MDVGLQHIRRDAAHVQGGDARVRRRLQLLHVVHALHHLVGHRVVDAEVAVLDVLGGQGARGGHLVPVRALRPALALALHEKAADLRLIPLRSRTAPPVRSCCIKPLMVQLQIYAADFIPGDSSPWATVSNITDNEQWLGVVASTSEVLAF